MAKSKSKLMLSVVVVIIGIIVVSTVCIISENIVFMNKHKAYEELVKGITVDALTNNTYISSLVIETNFELKNSYEQYNWQNDKINIKVNLSDDFDAMSIKDRCVILDNIEVELETILSEGKINTGYADLCKDFMPYNGANVKVDDEVDVEYLSKKHMYKFDVDEYSTLYVEKIEGNDYVIYKIERIGDDIASVKEREYTAGSSSSSSTTPSYTGAYDATLKYKGTDGVLICISEDALERFMTAVNNGNEGTLQELFLEGQCAYTEQGTKCNIVDRKLTRCQVKLLDGSYAGNTVWVVIESLQEE